MVKLPSASSASFVLRFLETMCRHLHCDNLFSSQPFSHYAAYDRTKSGKDRDTNSAANNFSIHTSTPRSSLSPKCVSFLTQSKKRRWILRHWLEAASGVCPECRRPTLLRCRPNICAPRLILQKVEDTAADFRCRHIWESLISAARIYTSYHLDQLEHSYPQRQPVALG